MRPPLPPASAAAAAAPAAQPRWPRARGPRRPYLRVGEIVEEEGGELFVQERAAVVPRHLPAAAAACGGVSAEPAAGVGGRARAAEGGGRSERGRREGAEPGRGCRRAAGGGGGAARGGRPRGSRPPLPAPARRCAAAGAAIRSRGPRPGRKAPAAGRLCPSRRPAACAAMRAAQRSGRSESRCVSAGRVRSQPASARLGKLRPEKAEDFAASVCCRLQGRQAKPRSDGPGGLSLPSRAAGQKGRNTLGPRRRNQGRLLGGGGF